MKKRDYEHFEKRLLDERQRVVRAVQQLEDTTNEEEDGDLTAYPFHLADEGTDTEEEEKGFLLRSAEGRLLYEIDEALRRLYKQPDQYGRCEQCGAEIAWDRLDLLPWARLCLEHQRAAEDRPVEAR